MATKTTVQNIYPNDQETDSIHQLSESLFSPGKFTPPQIDPHQHLFRQNALRPLVLPDRIAHHIFIHAQAGQGKSTLSVQYLQHIKAPFAWIQVDPQDRKPALLITALFSALLKNVAPLSNSITAKAILNGELDGDNPEHAAQMLAGDLAPHIKNDHYLVIDDVHLLAESTHCIRFLVAFKAHLPLGLHLIFLSRTPIETLAADCLCLDNTALALSRNETENLFTQIYQIDLPAEMVTHLHNATQGWIMAAVMAKHSLMRQPASDSSVLVDLSKVFNTINFPNYFERELLTTLDPAQRQTLLSLTLLDEIPIDLVKSISQNNHIPDFIHYLVKNNFFIRFADEAKSTYFFHHLFKTSLKAIAVKELDQPLQRRIMAKAGHWMRRRNHIEQALRYYIKAGIYGLAEKILSQYAIYFRAANRIDTFDDTIKDIPAQRVVAYPWLSLSIAVLLNSEKQITYLDYLKNAHEQFLINKDTLGELFSKAVLIIYLVSMECQFAAVQKLLPRAEALYHSLSKSLPVAARVQSAYAICFGLCHCNGQTRKAAEILSPLFEIAQEHGFDDAAAGVAGSLGNVFSLEGGWPPFRKHLERLPFLILSPRVGQTYKLILLGQILHFSGLEGDFTTYAFIRELMKHYIDQSILSKMLLGHFLMIADINMALAQGRFEQAAQIVQTGLASQGIGQSFHIQSVYTGYQAYLLALENRKNEAIHLSEKSLQLREQAGGRHHQLFSHMISGATYGHLQEHVPAQAHLTEAISQSEALGEKFVRIAAYAHRAILGLNGKHPEDALVDIRQCLEMMRSGGFVHFYTWTPKLMEELLAAAIANGIEVDYACQLAADRLNLVITPDGNRIPILEIVTLGDFHLKIGGEVKVRFENLTASQRELFAMLISTHETGLSVETIQLIFWPDSPPQKVRSKFDNMLTRLRKTLNKGLAPYSANLYLLTERGHLRLNYCRIDADHFSAFVQKGLDHLKAKEFYQAANALLKANILFRGLFMPGVNLKETARHFAQSLKNTFMECTQHWVFILSTAGRIAEAISYCEKALNYNPTCQPLVKSLYGLRTQNNETEKAAEVIENYKTALVDDGFTAKEIASIMDTFWS